MVLGPADPGPAAIEVLTGSPYGLSLHGPDLPVFRPAGWTPEIGIAGALDLLGWTCERTSGSVDEAVARIARATPTDPVVTGPFEMGLLPHHHSLGQTIGTEHYFVVLGLEGDVVRMHDPRGFPLRDAADGLPAVAGPEGGPRRAGAVLTAPCLGHRWCRAGRGRGRRALPAAPGSARRRRTRPSHW